MATNGTHTATEIKRPPDKAPARPRLAEDTDYFQAFEADSAEVSEPALASMVDKLAQGIAQGMIAVVRELERHIATETRKVGDAVDRRLDTLQVSIQEVSRFAEEQRSANVAVQNQLQQLATAGASLLETNTSHTAELHRLDREAGEFSASVATRIEGATALLREVDARQGSALETLRSETRALSSANAGRIDEILRDMGVYEEDMVAIKEPIGTLASRVDTLVERLDRQADAFRSMNAAHSQRESELEQVMDSLVRLRGFKAALPASGL